MKIGDIRAAVATYYGLTQSQIQSKARSRRFCYPRMIAAYLARELTDKSTTQIAMQMGYDCHKSTLDACRRISFLMASNSKLQADVTILRNWLTNQPAQPFTPIVWRTVQVVDKPKICSRAPILEVARLR